MRVASARGRHGGVIANLKVERVATGSIGARLEQQRVALRPELVGDLLGCYCVDCRLDHALVASRANSHSCQNRKSTHCRRMGALLALLQFPPFAYSALTFAEPLVAARKLERSEPSVPAKAGGCRVILLGVPKRARV